VPTRGSRLEIHFTKKALDRLIEAALFIYERSGSIQKADRFMDELKECIEKMLGSFPRLGRPAPEFGEGIRKLVCRTFTVLYRIERDRIVVLTLFRENLP